MFGQFKNKIAQWCRSQVKVLSTEHIEIQARDKHRDESFNFIMMLPRNSYFEAYKTYPLSVGRDIAKIATIEGRQISPYTKPSWSGTLVIKQPEQYLVYYFVLLPKYQHLVEKALPLFVVPETAHSLLQLTKGKEITDPTISFHRNDSNIWLSSVTNQQSGNSGSLNFSLEQITLPTVRAFFNPKVLHQLKGKFNRWQQVKWLSISVIVASLYLGATNLYLSAMDQYLTGKGDEARPIISELFKVKDELTLLQQQQEEFATIYQTTTEKLGALQIIEQQYNNFTLRVKSIEIVDSTVRLQGTATNANALLEQLLNSEFIEQAEFKSDIKVARGAREEFEIEFVWSQPLWKQEQKMLEGQG